VSKPANAHWSPLPHRTSETEGRALQVQIPQRIGVFANANPQNGMQRTLLLDRVIDERALGGARLTRPVSGRRLISLISFDCFSKSTIATFAC